MADRVEASEDDEIREDFLRAHKEQASVTKLEVDPELLAFRPYALPKSRATSMRITPGMSGRVPENPSWAIISVISVKP